MIGKIHTRFIFNNVRKMIDFRFYAYISEKKVNKILLIVWF